MAMGRWVVETTTALACPAEAATTLEALRSCSIIHTYSVPAAVERRHTIRRERDTGHTSGYAHGPRTSLGHGQVGSGDYHGPSMPS